MGGAVVSAQAQHGHRGNGYGYGRGYRVHEGRWEDCNRSYRGAYYDCRPGVRVVPVPAPVVYAPVPAPVVYAPVPPPPPPAEVVYVKRPRVVINANISL